MICLLALAGMMTACGGDEFHNDAKKLADLTVEQMRINNQMSDFTTELQKKYGDNDSVFTQFQLLYVQEMLKLDIEDDFREYLIYMDSVLRGEATLYDEFDDAFDTSDWYYEEEAEIDE